MKVPILDLRVFVRLRTPPLGYALMPPILTGRLVPMTCPTSQSSRRWLHRRWAMTFVILTREAPVTLLRQTVVDPVSTTGLMVGPVPTITPGWLTLRLPRRLHLELLSSKTASPPLYVVHGMRPSLVSRSVLDRMSPRSIGIHSTSASTFVCCVRVLTPSSGVLSDACTFVGGMLLFPLCVVCSLLLVFLIRL